MSQAVVVGGGIAGILSALVLKRRFSRVRLVEKEERLGGLLKSFRAPDGTAYDYGTHFPSETGDAELDELLLGPIRRDEDSWRVHTVLRVGNYFQGRLNDQSPCVDARALPRDLYEKGIQELLAAPAGPGAVSWKNLREQLAALYGPTFAGRVFGPALKKLYGAELEELAPDSHLLFILPRLIAFDPAKARELKKDPRLDAKLAFHSYREPPSTSKLYYPKAGGVGRWVELLERELERAGVEVLCGAGAGDIAPDAQLVWTTPVFELLRARGVKLAAAPPALRQTTLYHFRFDRPFATDLHFLTCFDPTLASFRATLYPSMREDSGQKAPYNATVEVIAAPGAAVPAAAAIAAELKTMGAVDAAAKVLEERVDAIKGGFPVLTPAFRAGAAAQLQAAREAAPGALFLGKARGTAFFMPDVLKEAHRELAALAAGAAR